MRRAVWGLIALLCLAGCGSEDDEFKIYAEHLKKQLAAQEEVAEILASVQSPEQMPQAREKLQASQFRLDQLVAHAKSLGEPSKAIRDRLQGTFGERIQAAMSRMQTQATRIEKMPGGEEFLKSLAKQ